MVRIVIVFLVALVVGFGVSAAVRAQVNPTDAEVPPVLTDDDTLSIQGVIALNKLANEACQSMSAFKAYQDQRQKVSVQMERKYPRFTLDWQAGALVPKSATGK